MKTYQFMLGLICASLSFGAFADDYAANITFGESYNFPTTNLLPLFRLWILGQTLRPVKRA